MLLQNSIQNKLYDLITGHLIHYRDHLSSHENLNGTQILTPTFTKSIMSGTIVLPMFLLVWLDKRFAFSHGIILIRAERFEVVE